MGDRAGGVVWDRVRKKRGACAEKTVGGEIDSADDDTSQWHSWPGALVLVFELVFVD